MWLKLRAWSDYWIKPQIQALAFSLTVTDIVLNKTITLLHSPISNWLIININWLLQDIAEYNISWNVITLWNNIQLTVWDIITINYFY